MYTGVQAGRKQKECERGTEAALTQYFHFQKQIAKAEASPGKEGSVVIDLSRQRCFGFESYNSFYSWPVKRSEAITMAPTSALCTPAWMRRPELCLTITYL